MLVISLRGRLGVKLFMLVVCMSEDSLRMNSCLAGKGFEPPIVPGLPEFIMSFFM